MKKFLALSCAVLAAVLSGCCRYVRPSAPPAPEFALHKNYGDHMVLQRNVPIRISGTATPGHSVTVQLGEDSCTAEADANGEWEAVMPARAATKNGESIVLSVRGAADADPLVIVDVLVGEVWICSGQSNMEMPMWTNAPHWRDNGGEAICKAANDNAGRIRLFDASATKYVSPKVIQSEPCGQWVVPAERDIARFSAVGYYFGLELNRKLDVPVGLVSVSWSGTRIQPWISAEAYRAAGDETAVSTIEGILDGAFDPVPQKNDGKKVSLAELQKQWHNKFVAFNPEAAEAARQWADPAFDDSSWEARTLDHLSCKAVGRSWIRYTLDIPQDWAGCPLVLNLGPVDDADVTYFNGVKVGSIDISTPSYWNVERKYSIPADLVKPGKAVIAVQILNYFGEGGLTNTPFLKNGADKIALNGTYRFKDECKVDTKVIGYRPEPESQPDGILTSPQTETTLFNSLIAPWTRYNCRGMIWYQGCSNAGEPENYARLFGMLREDWMKHWNNPDMVFITTQLSGWGPGRSWPAFREMQFDVAQKYSNVGIAVSIDKGDEKDIHPHNKRPVSQRLCAEAMRLCYGYSGLTSGPVFSKCEVKDGTLVLTFDCAGKGLTTANGRQPAGFEIAGEDGVYYPALAVISGRNRIVLSAQQVAAPVSARYAWCAYNGDLNVENRDGFPMVPFRTSR